MILPRSLRKIRPAARRTSRDAQLARGPDVAVIRDDGDEGTYRRAARARRRRAPWPTRPSISSRTAHRPVGLPGHGQVQLFVQRGEVGEVKARAFLLEAPPGVATRPSPIGRDVVGVAGGIRVRERCSASASRPGVDEQPAELVIVGIVSGTSVRQNCTMHQRMRAPDGDGPVDARHVARPAAAAASHERRHPEVLRVPVPAVLIPVQGVEGAVVEDAVACRGDAGHERGVARVGDRRQHARDGIRVGALRDEPPEVRIHWTPSRSASRT